MDLMTFLETDHKKLIRAKDAAKILEVSYATVYDWKYRQVEKEIPEGMFVKIGSMLYLRSDLLKSWIASKSS